MHPACLQDKIMIELIMAGGDPFGHGHGGGGGGGGELAQPSLLSSCALLCPAGPCWPLLCPAS